MQDNFDTDEYDYDDEDSVSKSAKKREADHLQQLGVELLRYSDKDLRQLDIPEQLCDAVIQLRQINSRSAMKRQRQYIGKIMRSIDTRPVEEAIAKLEHQQASNTYVQHQSEQWRDSLIQGGKAEITHFIAEFPDCEIQKLGQLVRAAQKEHNSAAAPKYSRELFRFIRTLVEKSAIA